VSASDSQRLGADRNLLFGILALQLDFVTRDALIQAMNVWVLDKIRPLGQILIEHGALATDRHELLDALVREHLKQHSNDPEKSLAALSSIGSIRDDLSQVMDGDVTASLARISVTHNAEEIPTLPVAGWPTSTAGRFRIIRPHAQGGLGEVFVARDEELHRDVALKQIQERYAGNPQSRSRFILEAEITGGLEHPGIVPVYGLGTYADGRPFYAMRFIKGDSLKDVIESYHGSDGKNKDQAERALEFRKLLGRFVDVCNAIAYAHSRGVLHRDLKPGNIMLGQYGETLVVDWGLAKPVGRKEVGEGAEITLRPPSASGSTPTQAGAALGTPAYMSPEQAAGKLDELGPASDVYSLGATLYCLLTGKSPIAEKDLALAIGQVRGGEIRSLREVNREVPLPLEAICRKAMALYAKDRYQSPRDLAEEIEHWLADDQVAAYREPLVERGRRWGRRHRTLVTGMAALLVTAVIGLAIGNALLGKQKEEVARQRDEAVRQQQRAEQAELAAKANESKAQAERDAATLARRQLEAEHTRSEWQLYANQIALAQREWNDNNAGHAREVLGATRKDFRGWEYHYLCALFGENQRTLRGHRSVVSSVVFSADGRRIASGSGDQTIKVWDTATGQETLTLNGHSRQINAVAFSPDGRRIASGSYDKTIKLWETNTGRKTLTLKGHSGTVSSVAFSPDGRRIASGSDDKTIKLWDTATGRETLTLKGHNGTVWSVAFSPDGRRIASGSFDRTIKLWDTATGREALTLKGHTDSVLSVAFNPDGRRIVSGGLDQTVKLWDTGTGQEIQGLNGHSGSIVGVAFSPDGGRIASGSFDETIKFWDTATGRETLTLKGHNRPIQSVAFSPDGRWVASGTLDRTISLWDTAASRDHESLVLKGHGGATWSVAFSPDGGRIASGSFDRTIKLWNTARGQETLTLKGHTGQVFSVAFSPDGRKIASGSDDRTVKLWDATTGQETLTLKRHSGPISSVAFSPDGRRIASGSYDETIRVWDTTTGQEILRLKAHRGPILSVAFSPDGRRIASGGFDWTIKLWDTATGQETVTLKGHSGPIWSVAFSADGRRIASGSEDQTIKLWDTGTGQESVTLKGHGGEIRSVGFSPDGRRIASGSDDRTIKVWETATGQETLTLKEPVLSVAFSPNGRRLASGGWDMTIKLWDSGGDQSAR